MGQDFGQQECSRQGATVSSSGVQACSLMADHYSHDTGMGSGKEEQAWRPCMGHTHAVMHAGRLRGSDTRSSCWVDECAWLTGRLGHAFPNAGERHSLVFGDICFTVTITLEIQDNVRCFALFFISQVKKLKEPIIQCHVFPSSHLWQGPSTMIESPPRGP